MFQCQKTDVENAVTSKISLTSQKHLMSSKMLDVQKIEKSFENFGEKEIEIQRHSVRSAYE